ncbi:DoxX family protein [Flavobacteriaceae bacterium 3-367]|uniref:DoxX family protein n=1 Tax=Eudoraea algarum TaxID=3417568 RepID=UPI00328D1490
MKNSLKNDLGLAVLRIASSAMLLTHGIPKFQKLINGNFEFPNPLGIGASPSLFLAVIGEFVCPILIIIGYKTRWATVPPAIVMLVAAFMIHGSDPFKNKELALLYLTALLTVMLLGPGRYSIDKR